MFIDIIIHFLEETYIRIIFYKILDYFSSLIMICKLQKQNDSKKEGTINLILLRNYTYPKVVPPAPDASPKPPPLLRIGLLDLLLPRRTLAKHIRG